MCSSPSCHQVSVMLLEMVSAAGIENAAQVNGPSVFAFLLFTVHLGRSCDERCRDSESDLPGCCVPAGPKAISGKAAAFVVFLVILQITAMQIFSL